MNNKTKTRSLKVAIIAVALLLCLALAIGITGAFYQAKRQATGTLSMDQGIIIDYKGFDKTGDEWSKWERTATLPLFSITNAQPGEQIAVNAAGIRANEKSVNFYARVKLSYKFYNGETPVEFLESTKLIKTSSSFFGTNWVESGDGYYYYATGSTLNKFEKGTQTFVDLFATDAKFIIEGAGFTGATSDGEGGGFVVGDTSINKIEVYLTLETLQGDADAAAEGWKITEVIKPVEVDVTTEEKPEINIDDIISDDKKDGEITITGDPAQTTTIIIGSKAFYGCTNLKLKLNKSENVIYQIATDAFSEGAKIWYGSTEVTNLLINADTTGKSVGKDGSWIVAAPNLKLFLPESITLNESNNGDFQYTDSQGTYYFDLIDEYSDKVDISSLDSSKIYSARINYINNNSNATKFVIPTYIGSSAFSKKYKVTEIGTISLYEFWKNRDAFVEVVLSDEVVHIGPTPFQNCSNLEKLLIPKNVEWIHFQNPFYGSEKLNITVDSDNTRYISINGSLIDIEEKSLISLGTDLVIPTDSRVEKIVYGACGGRNKLETLNVPGNIKTIDRFACSDSNIKYINILSGVQSIAYSAFYQCYNIISINLPETLTKIEDYAFTPNANLKSINVSSLNNIYSSVSNCLIEKATKTLILACSDSIIPNDGSVTKLGGGFISNIESISIPDQITEIAESAFYNCGSLENVTIGAGVSNLVWLPTNVTNITISESNPYFASDPKSIFMKKDNNELELGKFISSDASYSIPESININGTSWKVTSIGAKAFANKWTLTSLIIPEGVNEIGSSCFESCSSLRITLPDSIKKLGDFALSGVTLNKVPKDLIEIGECAFDYSKFEIDTIIINADLISNSSFYGCSGIKSVILKGNLKSIPTYCFSWCESLESIVLPSTIEEIGEGAFEGCSNLKTIYVNSENATAITDLGFTKMDDTRYNENGIEDASGSYYKYSGTI